MSIPNKTHDVKKKAMAPKAEPQTKTLAKPQPMGLSREEIRQIVLEMIG